MDEDADEDETRLYSWREYKDKATQHTRVNKDEGEDKDESIQSSRRVLLVCQCVLTLRAHQDERHLGSVAVVCHLGVVVVDGVEGGLILEAEDEDNSIHPRRELQEQVDGHVR